MDSGLTHLTFTSPATPTGTYPLVPLLIHPAPVRCHTHLLCRRETDPSGIPGTGEYRIELDRLR